MNEGTTDDQPQEACYMSDSTERADLLAGYSKRTKERPMTSKSYKGYTTLVIPILIFCSPAPKKIGSPTNESAVTPSRSDEDDMIARRDVALNQTLISDTLDKYQR